MADSFTANLNLRKPEVGAANDNWGNAPSGLNGDMDLIDAVFNADGGGTSVGLHVGTGKVLEASAGMAVFTDARLFIRDDADATKALMLDIADVLTGTTAVFRVPAASDTLVGKDAAQKLTNKTATTPAADDNSEKVATTAMVQAAIAASSIASIPSGVMWEYAGGAVPPGWLACDGSTLLKVDYPTLAAVLGTRYGAGDATHFVLPDTRGRVTAGADSGGSDRLNVSIPTSNVIGAAGGDQQHTLTAPQIPAHVHPNAATWGGPTPTGGVLDSGANNNTPITTGGNGGSAGGGQAHNNVQPTLIITKIIKV